MSPRDPHDGDETYTGLLGRNRVPKYDRKIEALGAVDEGNAALGLARAQAKSPETIEVILQVQRDLYALMSEIAANPENVENFRSIDIQKINWMESTIQKFDRKVNMPFEFIVPGDSLAEAALDLARTVIRRAERRVVELAHAGDVENPNIVHYLNRASYLCYLMELFENIQAGQARPTLAKD